MLLEGGFDMKRIAAMFMVVIMLITCLGTDLALAESKDKLSTTEMKADLDYLIDTLKSVHTSTIEGFNKVQKNKIEDAYDKIERPLTKDEFFFVINDIITSLNDAHTVLELNKEDTRWIDMPFVWTEEGMIVTEDTDKLSRGDKILSIGKKTEKELYVEVNRIIPAENIYWKRNMARLYLTNELILDNLKLIKDGKVNVKLERSKRIINEELPLISIDNIINKNKQRNAYGWHLEEENSLAIFYIDKCIYNKEYEETVRDFFTAVSKNDIENIGIDLRRNSGGNSKAIETFLKYLDIDKYDGFSTQIRYSKQAKEKIGYTKTSGYYIEKFKDIKNTNVDDKGLIYDDDIFILTSPDTFSTGNLFALLFRDNKLAETLGEPTGNATTVYGGVLEFKLANSGYKFTVPHKKLIRPDESKGYKDSVYPDISVYTKRKDIIDGIDSQMEKLRSLASKDGPNEYIKILLDEKDVTVKGTFSKKDIIMPSKPKIINGSTLIDIEGLKKITDIEVNITKDKIKIENKDSEIILIKGSKGALINSEWKNLIQGPTEIDGVLLVPLRSIAEGLGYKIKWNGVQRKILLIK